MRKFEVTIERTQSGKALENKTQVIEVESNRVPVIGESKSLLVSPPITETIIDVKEIHGDAIERHLLVIHERQVCTLTTCWTDEELENSGFKKVEEFEMRKTADAARPAFALKYNNELIANFMGLVVVPSGTKPIGEIEYPEVSEAFLKYSTSWDALMPVVEKCRKVVLEDKPIGFQATINTLGGYLLNTDIENVFKGVLLIIRKHYERNEAK